MIPHATSPLIDAGDSTKNDEETDIAGQMRKMDGLNDGTVRIDIGAYEHQAVLTVVGSGINPSRLYPNPAADVLNIAVDGAVINQVIIYSLSGDKILSQKMQGREKQQLDISKLASGVYILNINTDKGNSQHQIIKY